MNALADLLDAMKIDGNLLVTPSIAGTFNRMHDALQKALPVAEFARADAAIRELQNVVELRAGLHHSDAGKKVPRAARKLGFDWPPSDWPRTQERVRDRTANAVREVRQTLEATI